MRYSAEQTKEIRKHQIAFLAKERARKNIGFYTLEGAQIKVNPGVFPPATDTKLLASHLIISPGDRTLEMSSGSGIISVIAGLRGASGYAIDINPLAVANSTENFKSHKVNMEAVQSDMFQNVPSEKFDKVFANGPFFDNEITDSLDYACYGTKSFVEKILGSIKTFLKPNGALMIVMAEWTDLDYFEQTIAKNGLVQKVVGEKSSDDGKRIYILYEVTK